MSLRYLKLTLAYDGTAYHGFQRQANAITIQEIVEEKLARLFGHPLRIAGSGRTDTGVHAREQVISFSTTGTVPTERIPLATRGVLPDDIVVMKAEETDASFHARFDARSKIYRYRILNTGAPDPLLRRFAWHYPWPLDLAAMNEAALCLQGKQDFSAFRSAGGPQVAQVDPVKTIFTARGYLRTEALLDFFFWGSGFLYHMVRNMIGTLILVGRGKMTPLEFSQVLESKKRWRFAVTAPPQGLCLERVFYEEEELSETVIRKILDSHR